MKPMEAPSRKPDVPEGGLPRVAVVVFCRNEERRIGRCLDSLLANDYDQRLLDIIVVDGMSNDRTREIVAQYCQKHSCVRMVDNPKKIIPAAMNVGIRAAKAEIVQLINVHAVYPPNFISALVRGSQQYGADNIGGLLEIDEGKTAWRRRHLDDLVASVRRRERRASNRTERFPAASRWDRVSRLLSPQRV